MNFNVDFNEVRSILDYVHENVIRLNQIQFCGGNEQFIIEIRDRLKRCLTDKNYLDFDGQPNREFAHQLRRITFYLMLNTGDLRFKHYLSSYDDIVHVLQDSHQLSKCLLLSLVWSLNLGQYFAEAIAYTPNWFAWPYFDQAVDTLKQVDPFESPKIVEELIVGVYQNIARSDERVLEDDDHSRLLLQYHDFALELLNTFMLVDLNKNPEWRQVKKSKYLGMVISHVLCIIIRCSKMFQTRATACEEHEAELVFGCVTYVGIKEEPRAVYGRLVSATLNKLNILLLNLLQQNFVLVKVNNYIDWSEVDISDELTLQRQVGEAAYHVAELIKSDSRFKHDVCNQLYTVSTMPQSPRDVIRNSNMGEIMTKLDSLSLDPEIREMWLDEFLSRGILVFDNPECLDTLEGNIEHMNTSHVQQMIKGISQLSDRIEDSSADKLRDCIHRTAQAFDIGSLLNLIQFSLALNPLGVDIEHNSFSVTSIQLFNRFTSADVSSTQPLILLLQNPVRFFYQLIGYAIKSDQQQLIFIDFINSLPNQVSHSFIQSSLASYVTRCSSLPADEIKLLSTLLVRMHSTQYENKSAFFKHIYQMISQATQEQFLPSVICLAESMHTIMKSNRAPDMETALSAPLLVMCATIVDFYRWDLLSFTEQRVHLVELLLDVIHELRKRFLPTATPSEKAFVLQRIASLKPITRIYFNKLQSTATENGTASQHPVEFVRFLLGSENDASFDLSTVPKPDLLGKLISIIIRCTPKECMLIANSHMVRANWFSVIALLNRIVARPPQVANSVECLRYSCQNLANVVKGVFKPLATDSLGKWKLITQYVQLIKEFEKNDNYEYLFMDAHYVITEILQELRLPTSSPVTDEGAPDGVVSPSTSTDEHQTSHLIKQAVQLLRECEAKQLLLQYL